MVIMPDPLDGLAPEKRLVGGGLEQIRAYGVQRLGFIRPRPPLAPSRRPMPRHRYTESRQRSQAVGVTRMGSPFSLLTTSSGR